MTAAGDHSADRADPASGAGGQQLPAAFVGLEMAVLDACAVETEWPAQVAAGIYAGVDFVIANPVVAAALVVNGAAKADSREIYERVIGRLTGLIRSKAPRGSRRPGGTDEALIAGIVGLVGDHIRVGRLDRLAELRPELVLLALLPYLGFSEAQWWANQADQARLPNP